jgi:hypothetical protein
MPETGKGEIEFKGELKVVWKLCAVAEGTICPQIPGIGVRGPNYYLGEKTRPVISVFFRPARKICLPIGFAGFSRGQVAAENVSAGFYPPGRMPVRHVFSPIKRAAEGPI